MSWPSRECRIGGLEPNLGTFQYLEVRQEKEQEIKSEGWPL